MCTSLVLLYQHENVQSIETRYRVILFFPIRCMSRVMQASVDNSSQGRECGDVALQCSQYPLDAAPVSDDSGKACDADQAESTNNDVSVSEKATEGKSADDDVTDVVEEESASSSKEEAAKEGVAEPNVSEDGSVNEEDDADKDEKDEDHEDEEEDIAADETEESSLVSDASESSASFTDDESEEESDFDGESDSSGTSVEEKKPAKKKKAAGVVGKTVAKKRRLSKPVSAPNSP